MCYTWIIIQPKGKPKKVFSKNEPGLCSSDLCQSHSLLTPPWTESCTLSCSTRRDFWHCYLEPNYKCQVAWLIERLRSRAGGSLCCLRLTYKFRHAIRWISALLSHKLLETCVNCLPGSAHAWHAMMHREFLACEHFHCLASTSEDNK